MIRRPLEFSERIADSLTNKIMYVFVDEAGNLSNYTDSGSKYFVLTAVLTISHEPLNQLNDLRHDLERESYALPRGFHAKEDPHPRRKRVLGCLKEMKIEIHTVAIKKDLVFLNRRIPESWVYGYGLKHMFGFLSATRLGTNLRNRLVFPIYSTGKTRREISETCRRVIEESFKGSFEIAIWETSSHPGLQIADYCSWAIQRKLERDDDTAISEIRKHLKSAFSPWGVELALM